MNTNSTPAKPNFKARAVGTGEKVAGSVCQALAASEEKLVKNRWV